MNFSSILANRLLLTHQEEGKSSVDEAYEKPTSKTLKKNKIIESPKLPLQIPKCLWFK
jgi:hypothetical protein